MEFLLGGESTPWEIVIESILTPLKSKKIGQKMTFPPIRPVLMCSLEIGQFPPWLAQDRSKIQKKINITIVRKFGETQILFETFFDTNASTSTKNLSKGVRVGYSFQQSPICYQKMFFNCILCSICVHYKKLSLCKIERRFYSFSVWYWRLRNYWRKTEVILVFSWWGPTCSRW